MDLVELEKIIKDKGLKKYVVADQIGTNRTSFYLKMLGEREFSQSEIMMLKQVLSLSDDQFLKIFFDDKVGKMSTEGVDS